MNSAINAKKFFVSLLVLVFFSWWTYMMIFAEPSPKPVWRSPQAKVAVQKSLQDFCAKIGIDEKVTQCWNIRYFAKQHWIASGSIYLTVNDVEKNLLELGWHKSDNSDESRYFYCKGEYTARIDSKSGYAQEISFMGGSYKCTT